MTIHCISYVHSKYVLDENYADISEIYDCLCPTDQREMESNSVIKCFWSDNKLPNDIAPSLVELNGDHIKVIRVNPSKTADVIYIVKPDGTNKFLNIWVIENSPMILYVKIINK